MVFEEFGIGARPGTDAFWTELSGGPRAVRSPGGWRMLFVRGEGPALLRLEGRADPVRLTEHEATGCWFTVVELPERMRVTYHFEAEGHEYADPLNPSAAGPHRSLTATPDLGPQPFWPVLGPDEVAPLPRQRMVWRSRILGGRRTIRIHRGAAPESAAGQPQPVVLLLDGDDWLFLHPAAAAVDAAVAAGRLPAVTLVFLPVHGVREVDLAENPRLWEAIVDELVPELTRSIENDGGAVDWDRLVVAGQSLGGLCALDAALRYPDVVRRIACQSGSFWWPEFDGPSGGRIAARVSRADLSGLTAAFDVGRHESPTMHRHCDEIARRAAAAGARVRCDRSPAGHDRIGWRHALLRDIGWLLTPAAAADPTREYPWAAEVSA
ncbi:alpha/beta hydrolase-fold protein [Nocardia sp. CDC159]|uniref:Alpha/beta hydrolase-fold protein n=1 Tax=Nocardia pulmonis TaxID=2951408 RepID=A0A9X2E2K7_9NOCA|nr:MULTISPECIES: alpha/beta hydrolase-fold protein [Nocardia]MCM6771948.1 alpha/beta hydrolase-fold protein [Nocardia pulmonis]MCM6785394.1 alpha/beta hydrolase-fold protein [Nocardia sp. CDC159]